MRRRQKYSLLSGQGRLVAGELGISWVTLKVKMGAACWVVFDVPQTATNVLSTPVFCSPALYGGGVRLVVRTDYQYSVFNIRYVVLRHAVVVMLKLPPRGPLPSSDARAFELLYVSSTRYYTHLCRT